jgi:hypothetical protein
MAPQPGEKSLMTNQGGAIAQWLSERKNVYQLKVPGFAPQPGKKV